MTSKSNAEKQAGKGVPVMEVKKADTAEVKALTQGQPTVEELQKKVEELTTRLNALPQDLNSRIEYFNQKKELIRKLSKLDSNAQSLRQHLDKIAEVTAKNDFETEEFILNIEAGNKYSKSIVFALQNPVLIGEIISYLLGKVEAKIEQLKNEIAA
jgi:vacuolar-type H+-ATPase subunit I/STV1